MKFYWSKQRGNEALVTTFSDLHAIIQKECVEWFFGGTATFGKTFEEVVEFLKDKKEEALWVGLANNIINKIGDSSLGSPFEHVKEEDLIKSFYRYKGGVMIPCREIWLNKVKNIYWSLLNYIDDLRKNKEE